MLTLFAWILLLAFIFLVVIGFGPSSQSKKDGAPVDFPNRLLIALLSIVLGILCGFLLFIPLYLLACVFMPPNPVNGHPVMPLGQFMIGAFLAFICGIIITIVAYGRILRSWKS